jgi:uncharacterized repeat protein (TIGR03847 family)
VTTDINPEIFTADYTGRPGERTFFLQSKAEVVSSYLIEKGQAQVLAERLRELLLLIDPDDTIAAAEPQRDPALELSTPVEPEWRVGTIGLSYDEEGDTVAVSMSPVTEDPAEIETPDDFEVRINLRRDQVRGFVLHALAVIGEGRPLCRLCGLPMDPEGHVCPAGNGHRLA